MARSDPWIAGLRKQPMKWTKRRRQFVMLIAQGHDPASICEIMCVSHSGYRAMQADTMFMLQAENMSHLVSRALQERVILLEDTLRFTVTWPSDEERARAREFLTKPTDDGECK